jgi:NAD(P)-dependent dehydrogenase (short-subunit alcohol dehydrogenase family)
MLMLLNWRIWAAAIVALALAASHWKVYVLGKNTERLANLELTQASIIAARAEEKENAKRVQNAQSNQVKALTAKVADTERAATERDSLRLEISAHTKTLDSIASCNQRTTTIGELLGACSERYESLAGKATGHAIDVKMLLEAWPK